VPAEDILNLTPPPADLCLRYGSYATQFIDLRLPKTKGPHPVALNIHGGYWRNMYSLEHAGHLCAALTAKGIATANLEYRRVGDEGGGWPGTLEDIRNAYHYVRQVAKEQSFDLERRIVIGHSAGGQLALALASLESMRAVVSLAGVVDLQRAFDLHLSNDAVVEFLGGKPNEVPEHYHEADPMQLAIPKTTQWLIHGKDDDVVPPDFSRKYVETKQKHGEDAHLLEIEKAGHFDVIDPRTAAWKQIEQIVLRILA
jgi:acetyl esterase/lipase